ncbi:hypothetical protein QAD02_018207 [Eretmocerus hayati]|uniref:Uncharacterized protein n=1 Tax=Eretmocerus hayati TaxID=131215 RepID=A0ACC2PG66_9HYME|nr:hypothetical protein QAD02_018207 [Eretmocerus hayati]
MEKLLPISIVTVLMVIWPISGEAEVPMDHLFNYIRDKMSVFKVNIIAPTFRDRSPLANGIVHETNKNFISNNLNYDNLTLIQDPVLLEDRMKIYGFEKIFERNALTMGIIECKNGSSVMRDMFTMLKYFHALNPLTRGKYILNLITKERVNLTSFFQRAWSQDFLDLTVLEWYQDSSIRPVRAIMIRNSTTVERVIAHSFNPFNDTISREALTRHTVIFPNKVQNLHQFPLTVMTSSYVDAFASDESFTEELCWYLNCTIRNIQKEESQEWLDLSNGKGETRKLGNDIPEIVYDLELSFFSLTYLLRESRLEDFREIHLMAVYIPVTTEDHFYLRRRKTYELIVSHAALVTFGSLVFTAWIFAMWAYLLGFKERNWSFLNILTAQMGGSIERRGRMKLSEMIFQMSIYVATFIIVTFGADHMFGIFILRPTLPEITTLQELAESNVDLVINQDDYILQELQASMIIDDSNLSKILNRTRTHKLPKGFLDFCEQTRSNSFPVDESINLCTVRSDLDVDNVQSDKIWRIDKIRDPLSKIWGILKLERISFYKDTLEALVCKFAEIGLVKKWQDGYNPWEFKVPDEADHSIPESEKDEKVPLQDQLHPTLFIGYILGTCVLVFELIWKRFIEKTEFGRLISAFYRDMHLGPVTRRVETGDPILVVPKILKFKVVPWKFDAAPTQDLTCKIHAAENNVNRVEQGIAEIHQH